MTLLVQQPGGGSNSIVLQYYSKVLQYFGIVTSQSIAISIARSQSIAILIAKFLSIVKNVAKLSSIKKKKENFDIYFNSLYCISHNGNNTSRIKNCQVL